MDNEVEEGFVVCVTVSLCYPNVCVCRLLNTNVIIVRITDFGQYSSKAPLER